MRGRKTNKRVSEIIEAFIDYLDGSKTAEEIYESLGIEPTNELIALSTEWWNEFLNASCDSDGATMAQQSNLDEIDYKFAQKVISLTDISE